MKCVPGEVLRGVARIFQRGGDHTRSNNIVMAFSPQNIVGCLLEKRLRAGHLLERGGGGLVQMGRGSYLFVYLKMRGYIKFCNHF